jgi:hypothetical protein
MASPKLTSEEALAIVEKQRQERLESTKNFLTGFAKAVTTDLPGFLIDVVDKMAGDTVYLGEKDRSAQLFEAMTGIKTKSGEGGVDELLGGMINPAGVAKAVIIPARLGAASKAVSLEKAGANADEIYGLTKTYRDPLTQSIKEVIPDTGADFLPGAINIKLGHQNPFGSHNNPSRVGELAHDIFTDKTLGDVLSHPFMDDLMGVEAAKIGRLILAPGVRGSFNPDKDTIRLASNMDPNQMLSTLLHETQHALQFRAGTQGGGNPGMFFAAEDAFEASKKSALKLRSALEAEFDKAFKGSQGLEQYNSPSFMLQNFIAETELDGVFGELAKRKLDKIPVKTLSAYRPVQEAKKAASTLSKASDDAFEGYKNLLGEAEARLVQTQHKLGDYTTHPLKLMADELGVRVDELPKVLIGDVSEIKPVDVSPEIKEAMEFVEKLMQARAAQGNPVK